MAAREMATEMTMRPRSTSHERSRTHFCEEMGSVPEETEAAEKFKEKAEGGVLVA